MGCTMKQKASEGALKGHCYVGFRRGGVVGKRRMERRMEAIVTAAIIAAYLFHLRARARCLCLRIQPEPLICIMQSPIKTWLLAPNEFLINKLFYAFQFMHDCRLCSVKKKCLGTEVPEIQDVEGPKSIAPPTTGQTAGPKWTIFGRETPQGSQ